MKIAKILPAFVGLTLVPAAGTLAADSLDSGTAGLDFAAPTTQMSGSDFFSQVASNLRWSVDVVGASSTSAASDDDLTLAGLSLKLSYFVDEKKEIYGGLSYMVGTLEEDVSYYGISETYEYDVDRLEVFGGFNYWFSFTDRLEFYVGGRVGVAQSVCEAGWYSSYAQTETVIFGALGIGGAYKLTEDMRVRLGVEYNTYLEAIARDYYDDYPFATYVMFSVGLEFKF